MIDRSGSHLVDLLGLSMLDRRVTDVLRELGVATPRLDVDRPVDAVARAHGLRFAFKPPHQFRDADSVEANLAGLALSTVSFHSDGHEGYAAYAGELPYGLTFNLSVEAVQAILDPQAPENPERSNRWDFGREYCTVGFTDDRQGITLVTVELPWSGVVRSVPSRDRRREEAVAVVDRLLARGGSRRDRSIERPDELPPELVAFRREQAEQETPFFGDQNVFDSHAVTLTFDPPHAHHYLSTPAGAGYERFFDDVLWIGEDQEGGLVGYWKGEADTFSGAPVVRLNNEGCCELEEPNLVDFFAGYPPRPELVDFCQRAGLPGPGTRQQREQALAGLPSPNEVMQEFVRRESAHVYADQPIRPLDRRPILVTLADGTVVVVSNEDDIALHARVRNNAAFALDPTERRFRALPPTARRLSLHGGGVGLLADGRAVFAETSDDTYCVLFDPAESTWRAGTPLGARHINAGAAVLPDGRVLVAGGEERPDRLSRCDLYDPLSDQWSETSELAVARSHTALAPVAGGALAIGGWVSGPGTNGSDSCERYDAATGAWTPVAPLPLPMTMPKALVLRSGLMLVSSRAEGWALYDPSRDVWTRSQRLQHTSGVAVELADSRVAFFLREQPGHPPETVFVLDVATATATAELTAAGTTQLPRHDSTAALLPDGTVLLVGGDLFHNLAKEPEIWDPATGRGQALPDLAEVLDRQFRNLATYRTTDWL